MKPAGTSAREPRGGEAGRWEWQTRDVRSAGPGGGAGRRAPQLGAGLTEGRVELLHGTVLLACEDYALQHAGGFRVHGRRLAHIALRWVLVCRAAVLAGAISLVLVLLMVGVARMVSAAAEARAALALGKRAASRRGAFAVARSSARAVLGERAKQRLDGQAPARVLVGGDHAC